MSVQIQTFALIHLQEKNKEIACPSLDTIDISQKYKNEWMWNKLKGKVRVRRVRVSVEKVYFKEENRGGELGIK